VKTWDVIVIGGGIIGLTLAIALRKRSMQVLLVERGEPAREASHAAAGMLADCPLEFPLALQPLATASARMYPEFVHELQDESAIDVGLRDSGTIFFPPHGYAPPMPGFNPTNLDAAALAALEPALAATERQAMYLKERSVDPRALSAAALKAARHRETGISSGTTVKTICVDGGRVSGVHTERSSYSARIVVNCAGAWSNNISPGDLSPLRVPTRPVKGQMLAVVGGPQLRHVIRSAEVYLVPRGDGRIVIGSTLEEAGYDKRTDVETIQRLHQSAIHLVPTLSQARILEDWAGLRPGTPDDLPILGATEIPGYFVATGHFRDGILLAPITAHVMAQVIAGEKPDHDLAAFSPQRFHN
jgi:glycine oxidase